MKVHLREARAKFVRVVRVELPVCSLARGCFILRDLARVSLERASLESLSRVVSGLGRRRDFGESGLLVRP